VAEDQQVTPVPHEGEFHHHHGHRKRKKRRSLTQRILRAVLVLIFFAAWGFGVWKFTQYLSNKDELGKKFHDVDPAGFDANLKSKY
jgi:hypothetical protein